MQTVVDDILEDEDDRLETCPNQNLVTATCLATMREPCTGHIFPSFTLSLDVA